YLTLSRTFALAHLEVGSIMCSCGASSGRRASWDSYSIWQPRPVSLSPSGGNLMTEHATLAIELTDDELLAVSGGSGSTHVTVGISQRNHASAGIAQF